MIDKVENEIALAIRDYVHRQPLEKMRRLCAIAEDWHNGKRSMMYAFWHENGHLLADGKQYRKLAKEAGKAASEASRNATGTKSMDEVDALVELTGFATMLADTEQKLRDLADVASDFAAAGMPLAASMVFQQGLAEKR